MSLTGQSEQLAIQRTPLTRGDRVVVSGSENPTGAYAHPPNLAQWGGGENVAFDELSLSTRFLSSSC
jgi:hypothetical protein